jgi:general transcription factor 3C polypeptide 3 (transcription factor C subunit 4)
VAEKLGQATALFGQGQLAQAVALLQEVIRLAPGAPDGYTAMATVYEARGDSRRSLDFKMIGAHLTPRDAGLWRQLAHESATQGNSRQAIYCLTRVLRLEPDDPHARWDRSVLYHEVGEARKAVEGLEKLRSLRPADGDVVSMLARVYHQLNAVDKAAQCLDEFLQEQPEVADATAVNMLAEILMAQTKYAEVLALFRREARHVAPPDGRGPVPLDLGVKAAVCHAYLGDTAAADEGLAPLLATGLDNGTYADLYLQAANAFWAIGDAQRSYSLLAALRSLPAYDGAALWARLATCLIELRDVSAACELYEDVLAQHPDDPDAIGAYAEVLVQCGRTDEAMRQLARMDVTHAADGGHAAAAAAMVAAMPEDPEAVMRRLRAARLRGAAGDTVAFLAMALPLVSQSVDALTQAIATAVAAQQAGLYRRGGRKAKPPSGPQSADGVFQGFVTKPKKRQKGQLVAVRPGDGGQSPEHALDATQFVAPPPPVIPNLLRDDEAFGMLVAVVGALIEARRLDDADRLVSSTIALTKSQPGLRQRLYSARLLAADIAQARGDHAKAADAMRMLLSTAMPPHGGTLVQWNTFALSLAASGTAAKHVRLLSRLASRNVANAAIPLAHGAALAAEASGPTPASLACLFRSFKLAPRQPLTCLALGCALSQHALSRGAVGDRHGAVLAAFGFLQRYAALRGNPAEASYNCARALHHLGLVHLAAPLYERALEEAEGGGGGDDISREAAYNLSRIYMASGASNLARQLLRRYLTV